MSRAKQHPSCSGCQWTSAESCSGECMIVVFCIPSCVRPQKRKICLDFLVVLVLLSALGIRTYVCLACHPDTLSCRVEAAEALHVAPCLWRCLSAFRRYDVASVRPARSKETATLPFLLLPSSPGFFEEVLFRGVIQQWLSTVLGGIPALVISSVLFGLAHSPVPGASSFMEACYGANFGLLYMVR